MVNIGNAKWPRDSEVYEMQRFQSQLNLVDLGESGWKSGEIAGRVNEADPLSLVLPVCRVLPWRRDNDNILIGLDWISTW